MKVGVIGMLKSKFDKKDNAFKAQKIFTDRDEPRTVFAKSIATYTSKDENYKPAEIIVYYGKGGIGKSALLKQLFSEEKTIFSQYPEYNIQSIFISLDAFDFSNPINVLLAIRDKVKGDCSLFDYAMIQYSAKAKFTIEEIMNKHSLLSSPVMDVLNEVIAIGTLSTCIPTNALKKAVSIIKDQKFKRKFKEQIEEMDRLSESELFDRMPYYLGLCIANAADSKDKYRHVIYFDSYESLLARTDTRFHQSVDEWLKELFISSETIRMIIASRERIQWGFKDPDWNEVLNQHLLSNMSEEDCKWFLEKVPITNEKDVNIIIAHAAGVPLYLDMCVNMYEEDVNKGKTFSLDSEENGEIIIDRYIRHLSKKEKNAVKILAVLGCFDLSNAIEIMKSQGIVYEKEELLEFMRKSIFLPLDEDEELWNVDKSVRKHQLASISDEKLESIITSIVDIMRDNPDGEKYRYFDAIFEVLESTSSVAESLVEMIVDIIEIYSTGGYWKELHTRLCSKIDSDNDFIKTIAVYSEIIYKRRTGNLADEQRFIEDHPLDEKILGKAAYMYHYLVIQNRHLQGYYDEALLGYKDLINDMNLIKQLIPTHTYLMISMKYADLLFLKGKFDESLKMVEKLLSEPNISSVDLIELLRIKGHIYRFNQKYKEAETIYKEALKIANDNNMLSYNGKLYTNMIETLCVTEPSDALEWYTKACQSNETLENGIELGKAYAAASVAYTNLEQYDEAIQHATTALEYADQTKYKAGKLFALIALYYAYYKNSDVENRKIVFDRIQSLTNEIKVYEFLMDRVSENEREIND